MNLIYKLISYNSMFIVQRIICLLSHCVSGGGGKGGEKERGRGMGLGG